MVGPAALRLAVDELQAKCAMKKRRACRVVGLAPATYYYRARRPEPVELREKLKVLAAQRPRWGYRRLHVLLKREGHHVNHKLVFRVYRAEGLAVRRKKRKRMAASLRVVPPPPTRSRQQWTMDFTQDSLASGRQFRTLNVIDTFTRECLVIEVDHSLPGARVVRVLQRLVELNGQPEAIPHRQRQRVHQRRRRCLGVRAPHQARLHHTRQADRERAHRELQREVQGRVPERELVPEPRPREAEDRGVPSRLQRGPAAQLAGQPDAVRVRRNRSTA
jgi:transposase InsO family protein